MTDITPCPRCHYGAGPQGAERYWEARWRDEKAHNDALVNALEKVRSYNVDIAAGRINYRPHDHIQVIDEALAVVGGA